MNKEHLQILEQGVGAWNKWRLENPRILPDLIGADLIGADLAGADLSGACLPGAYLINADLSGANLGGAELGGADLTGAKLRGARLTRGYLCGVSLSAASLRGANLIRAALERAWLNDADLRDADLTGVNLCFSDLCGADLRGAYLRGAAIKGAKVSQVIVHGTLFGSLNLRDVEGLGAVIHQGPSEVSSSTMYFSDGDIPEIFLRGCGLRDWEIEATKLYRADLTRNQYVEITYKIVELRSDPMIQFYSCFISYSSKDDYFANRLYSDLQQSGVRCWFAPEHMKIGDRIRNRIDESVRLHDKLLLILSDASVTSQWIEQEVETALEKEREQRREVLFPVRLDDSVMDLRSGWPALIKNTRHIGDFRQWENPEVYQRAFAQLLNDLREEG